MVVRYKEALILAEAGDEEKISVSPETLPKQLKDDAVAIGLGCILYYRDGGQFPTKETAIQTASCLRVNKGSPEVRNLLERGDLKGLIELTGVSEDMVKTRLELFLREE